MADTSAQRADAADAGDYASHGVRLSSRQWRLLGVLMGLFVLAAPRAWEAFEQFEPVANYRIPYELSGDYWHFARYGGEAATEGRVVLIGDSVIWGQYVAPDEALPSCLNAATASSRFANLGVDGMHPAALHGLVRHYGRGLARARVVLHCNPLWMSSARHDLQGEREFAFNHPELVPQFTEAIPCYRQSFGGRLDIVVTRSLPFLGWTRHLRLAYYEGKPMPQWTLDHPYDCPVRQFAPGLPAPSKQPRREALPWRQRGLTAQDMPWVSARDSFQWRMFRRTVECLQKRDAAVFALVGPFNEHMLSEDSRRRYRALHQAICSWLDRQSVPYLAPDALPSDEYADASHPLASGYRRLAGLLLVHEGYRKFAGL